MILFSNVWKFWSAPSSFGFIGILALPSKKRSPLDVKWQLSLKHEWGGPIKLCPLYCLSTLVRYVFSISLSLSSLGSSQPKSKPLLSSLATPLWSSHGKERLFRSTVVYQAWTWLGPMWWTLSIRRRWWWCHIVDPWGCESWGDISVLPCRRLNLKPQRTSHKIY